MQLRIVGIFTLVIASSLFGYMYSIDYLERISQLEKIKTMLMHLKGEINYSNNSVGESLKNVSLKIDGVISEFLNNVQLLLKENKMPLDKIWESVTDEFLMKSSKLNRQDLTELKEFGKGLGTSDRQTQVNNILRYEKLIEIAICELKECKNEKCKLYRTFGIMVGVFLAIIFI